MTVYANTRNLKGKEDDNPYGIGAQYKNGGILVFADYLTNDSDDTSNPFGDTSLPGRSAASTRSTTSLVMGQYESLTQNIATGTYTGPAIPVAPPGAVQISTPSCPGTASAANCTLSTNNDQEGTWWHVAGSYTMGNNMVYLGYGQSSFDDLLPANAAQDGLDADALTVAGTHNLSKRTKIYAAYSMQSQDADNNVNDSHCIQLLVPVQDVDKDVFAIGMKHKF